MPYLSSYLLTALTKDALTQPEFVDGLRDAHISQDQALELIEKRRDEILKLVEGNERDYKEQIDAISNFENFKEKYLSYGKILKRINILIAVIFLLFFIVELNWDLFFFKRQSIHWFWDLIYPDFKFPASFATWARITMTLLSGFLAFLIKLLIDKLTNNLMKKRWENWTKINPEEILNWEKAKANKAASEKVISKTALEKGINEILRSEINTRLLPSYELILTSTETNGLAEVIDISKSIDTDAKAKLEFLINTMPGESIGIAGPRGAGKSTLIKSFCEFFDPGRKIKGKLLLSVFSTSPVKYDSREFILHLFYQSCQRLFDITGESVDSYDLYPKNKPRSYGLEIIRFVFPLTVILAFFSIIIIPIALWIRSKHNYFVELRKEKQNIVLGFYDYFVDTISKKESASADLFSFALILLLISVVLFILYMLFRNKIEIHHAINQERFEEISRLEHPRKELFRDINPDGIEFLLLEASAYMRKIKFQKSFTQNASGGLKFPMGFETAVSHAATTSEYPMSNPEIISLYTKFLKSLSNQFQVIIGIDELDKLESDENATNFLNEIKSIFGIPGCFFLISVSENALSKFDRRGLPFRDVFDSSFDNIVYVDNLELEDSLKLLQRRVVGKQMIFMDLAHSLSGGLPRDVIRYYREIVRLGQKDKNLKSIVRTILSEDISAKVRALTSTFNQLPASALLDNFFEKIIQLTNSNLGLEELNDVIEKIAVIKYEKSALPLINPAKELYTYLAYISTILSVFSRDLTPQEIMNLETKGFFSKLASIRRMFSVNTTLAFTMINSCRKEEEMNEFDVFRIFDPRTHKIIVSPSSKDFES